MRRIVGMDQFHIEEIWDSMYRYNRKPVAKGLYISAMGAVDIAVSDIIGKALNSPLCEVLVAFSERLRVYATGGSYGADTGRLALVKAMHDDASLGVPARKMYIR